jgi:uncharacterized membrane protein YoaK (UPF0700 family)
MHSMARDVRLLMLAITAGSADGWSYCGLGHAFVANMTGNTVLLGIAVFQNHGDLLHPAIALACYAGGALLGSLLAGRVRPEEAWPRVISWTLMLEALLLLAAQAGWIAVQLHARHSPSLNLLLATLALAIGIQSGTMVQLKIPGIVTTYITGTWTTMLSGLVRLARHEPSPPGQKVEFEQRLILQAAVLSVYFLAAVLSGWLFRYHLIAVGAMPAISVLLVAIHGVVRGSTSRVV